MKNEKQPQRRQGTATQKSKDRATAQAVGRIHHKSQQTGRRKRNCAGQVTVSTCGIAANGFLKQRFLPLYEPGRDLPEALHAEKGVFSTLSLFAGRHALDLMDLADKPYPYNILLAYWNAEQEMNKTNKDLELFIVSNERDEINMATKQTASRACSLYYLPVLPLYRLVKSGKNKPAADLLLSVFAYLRHVAGVPYYRDAESYLFYHYEILADWIVNDINDTDEYDLNLNRSALYAASHFGDIIGRKIQNPCHLDHFGRRIKDGKPMNPFGAACLQVAKTAFDLWCDFPQGNIYGHLPTVITAGEETDDDDYTNTIYVGEYIHFIAENEGSLYDSIQQNIDTELNEKLYWQEHSLISVYDENNHIKEDSLEFENRFFALLDELANLLNNLP